jgi:hypothetical protein
LNNRPAPTSVGTTTTGATATTAATAATATATAATATATATATAATTAWDFRIDRGRLESCKLTLGSPTQSRHGRRLHQAFKIEFKGRIRTGEITAHIGQRDKNTTDHHAYDHDGHQNELENSLAGHSPRSTP